MENTLSNKAKFFAQYWGQFVAIQNEGGGSGFSYDINEATICDIKHDYLQLTPITNITDEDATDLISFTNVEFTSRYSDKRVLLEVKKSLTENIPSDITDVLRSKGYALLYMGLSVDKLIEYGWVKLK